MQTGPERQEARKGQRMRSWETLQLLHRDGSKGQPFFVTEKPAIKHVLLRVSVGMGPRAPQALPGGVPWRSQLCAVFLSKATRYHLFHSLQKRALSPTRFLPAATPGRAAASCATRPCLCQKASFPRTKGLSSAGPGRSPGCPHLPARCNPPHTSSRDGFDI